MRSISYRGWLWLGPALSLTGLLAFYGAGYHSAAQTSPGAPGGAPPSAFKLTFGLKGNNAPADWSGGLRNPAQARAVTGWHLGAADSLTQPAAWQVTLRRVGVPIPARAVILGLATPEEQPVPVSTRSGDFTFVPAAIPYGKIHVVDAFDGDVTVERVPLAATSPAPPPKTTTPRCCAGATAHTGWRGLAYRTRSRNGVRIDGADEVMVANSRDGRTWSAPQAITPPGDHFRAALAEDGGGRLWCVYGLQKQMETGNFDLYARGFDGRRWSGERATHQLAAARYLPPRGFRRQGQHLSRVDGIPGPGPRRARRKAKC